MIENIPVEMQRLPQWVCCRPDKIPLNPRTGNFAIVTDKTTWATFEEAKATGLSIGFVLSIDDPFTIIDLDNKPEKPITEAEWEVHKKILTAFNSYTERSTGGLGFHIVVKGKIPSGLHRGNVEVYSSGRFMICTGRVENPRPIEERQELLNSLVGEMKPQATPELEDHDGILSDEEILEMAMRASNGEKFNALCRGDWSGMGYPSQSEADLALLSILAFYSTDNEQCRRLFRMSNLGKREKAVKDNRYLNLTLKGIRAKQPPLVDLSKLKAPEPVVINETPPNTPPPPPKKRNTKCSRTSPPGLIGEMANYIYKTSIRPVPEVALAASLALASGVWGRCYNISGSGLNQYIILLAKTGAGKEGAALGIDRLLTAVRKTIPMADQFIGPAAFASGQALIKALDEKPSFVSILGEFGFTLQQLCDQGANSTQLMLKRVLLDLYSKSGWDRMLRSSVYSDTDKNTKIIRSPNVSILGESTPEAFFEGLSSSHVAEGLIPRFSIIEYTGERPPRNGNTQEPPDEGLVARLTELVGIALTRAQNQACSSVPLDPAAQKVLDEFDVFADSKINGAGSDAEMQVWNRAHLKALKLSALIAVGVNPHNTCVTRTIAEWAVQFVIQDVETLAKRFAEGEIGKGDHRHEFFVRKAIEEYLEMGVAQRRSYYVPKVIVEQQIIPFHYLRRRCRKINSFLTDRRGSAKALEEVLKDMVKAEILKTIPMNQVREKFNLDSELFICGPTW